MLQATQTKWQQWINYFEHNAANLMSIDWDNPYHLTDTEIHHVRKSIQQFQLGESSDGNHVIAQAKRYMSASGDRCFLPALRLFIQEEQRHSTYLARFLRRHGVSLVQKHPVDSVFRLLRHALNLELSVMAMLTAEIIAMPYYKALHDATHSPLLRQICRQVLRDEIQHLQFQADTLKTLRNNQSELKNTLMQTVHRILLAGAICIVWQQHHDVFAAANYTFTKFWRTSWLHFNRLFTKVRAHYAGATQ